MPWRAREAFVVGLLSLVITAIASVVVVSLIDGEDLLTAWIVTLSEVALIAALLLWVRARYRLGAEALGLRDTSGRNVTAGVLAGLLGLGLSTVVQAIVFSLAEAVREGPVQPPVQLEFEEPSRGVLFLTGIGVVIIAPIAEEMFFRGFLFRALRRWLSLWPAAMLSAAVFAAVHIQPLVIPSIFVLGVVLAVVVERRGSIVPSIAAHVTFNLVGYTILLSSLGE